MKRLAWLVFVWLLLIAYRHIYAAVSDWPRWSLSRFGIELVAVLLAMTALNIFAEKYWNTSD